MALSQSPNNGRGLVGRFWAQWASEFRFPLLRDPTSVVKFVLIEGRVNAKTVR